jgi:hypothetical protein
VTVLLGLTIAVATRRALFFLPDCVSKSIQVDIWGCLCRGVWEVCFFDVFIIGGGECGVLNYRLVQAKVVVVLEFVWREYHVAVFVSRIRIRRLLATFL